MKLISTIAILLAATTHAQNTGPSISGHTTLCA